MVDAENEQTITEDSGGYRVAMNDNFTFLSSPQVSNANRFRRF